VFAPGDGAQVFRADSREAGNFVFGKSFLRGLDGDQFSAVLYESGKRLEHLEIRSECDR
jgi:hypothetical protein